MLNAGPHSAFYLSTFPSNPSGLFSIYLLTVVVVLRFFVSPLLTLWFSPVRRSPSAVNILCTSCANQPFCCAQQLIYVLISIKRKCAGAWRMCNWSFAASIRFVQKAKIHMDFVYICTQKATHLYTTLTPRYIINYECRARTKRVAFGRIYGLFIVPRNGSRFEWPRFDLNCLPPLMGDKLG